MPVLRHDQLKRLYKAFIEKLGGTREEAKDFADMFVMADLRATAWQGLMSLNRHVISGIREGRIKLGEEIRIKREGPAFVVLDGRFELGQLACKKAMELAIKKAKDSGVGLVSIRNLADTGALCNYTVMAVENDCIGIFTNNSNPYIAPWGGSERIFGADPVSIAIPAGKKKPIVVDMNITSSQAFQELSIWLQPFQMPETIYFSSLREYCYAMGFEVLAAALAGMPLAKDKTQRGQCGGFCMAIHIPHFVSIKEFKKKIDRYIEHIKSSQVDDQSSEILIPGERAFRNQEQRLKEGVPVPEKVWNAVKNLADEIGVDWEKAIDPRSLG